MWRNKLISVFSWKSCGKGPVWHESLMYGTSRMLYIFPPVVWVLCDPRPQCLCVSVCLVFCVCTMCFCWNVLVWESSFPFPCSLYCRILLALSYGIRLRKCALLLENVLMTYLSSDHAARPLISNRGITGGIIVEEFLQWISCIPLTAKFIGEREIYTISKIGNRVTFHEVFQIGRFF